MIIRMRAAAAAPLPLLLCACSWQSYQNMLGGAGLENRQFQVLFWIFLAVCGVMYVLVIGFLIAAILRRRRIESGQDESLPLRAALIGWAALIGVGLSALAVASFATDRTMAEAAARDGLSITVTANQWWWDISYDAADPAKVVHTANELHLPAGMPARIRLRSNDVIHSLWIPSLHGKKDLIPGHTNILELRADRAGTFTGECAEFCGDQHAFMAIDVVALAPAEFEAWADAQRRTPAPPAAGLARRGYDLFMEGDCAKCHTVRGTRAHARKAPDLTHVASRMHLVGGRMGNSPEELAMWIDDPQRVKPGAKMPPQKLGQDDLRAVVAYLETLQ